LSGFSVTWSYSSGWRERDLCRRSDRLERGTLETPVTPGPV
jgi:hypothetical protein